MVVKIGINGFGRIGRLVFRVIESRRLQGEDIVLAGINDPFTDIDYIAYLIRNDTVHGHVDYNIQVDEENSCITINNNKITLFKERDPANINWSSAGVEYVVESTGVFRKKEQAEER